jgi:hypothetical protein
MSRRAAGAFAVARSGNCRSCTVFHHFANGGQITRLSVDPGKGMAGRTAQAVIDALEGNYNGDPTKMPYVVNKEAFEKK